VVEGRYVDGKLEILSVTPPERAADVIEVERANVT